MITRHVNMVQLPPWRYISGTSVTPGGSPSSVDVPSTATIFEIRAEGGSIMFAINGTAGANSPGFVPANSGTIVGPLSNLDSLSVYATAGIVAHVMFFSQV